MTATEEAALSWMEFISSLVASLAWPTAIVVVLYLFRGNVKSILQRITSIKAGGVELFAEKVQEVVETTRELPGQNVLDAVPAEIEPSAVGAPAQDQAEIDELIRTIARRQVENERRDALRGRIRSLIDTDVSPESRVRSAASLMGQVHDSAHALLAATSVSTSFDRLAFDALSRAAGQATALQALAANPPEGLNDESAIQLCRAVLDVSETIWTLEDRLRQPAAMLENRAE